MTEPNYSPDISIIIPVYNVEKYVTECIKSILGQSYTNFEVILVDDGSTDSSGEICDSFSYNDSRIRVFHSENGGVSKARNIGLKAAIGEWVLFIDADDWLICSDALDCISQYFQGAEIIQFKYKRQIYKQTSMVYCEDVTFKNFSRNEYLCNNIKNTSVWGNVIKREIIRSNHIEFQNGIAYAEDFTFINKCISVAKNITVLNKEIYAYRINENSAMNAKYTLKRGEDHLSSLIELNNFYIIQGYQSLLPPRLKNAILILGIGYWYNILRAIKLKDIIKARNHYNESLDRNGIRIAALKCFSNLILIVLYKGYLKIKIFLLRRQ